MDKDGFLFLIHFLSPQQTHFRSLYLNYCDVIMRLRKILVWGSLMHSFDKSSQWVEVVVLIVIYQSFAKMGRLRNFIGNRHFRIGVNSANCKVEGCGYEYRPKRGSDVHATPLIGHLKRKHPQIYSEAVEEEKKKPKVLSLTSFFRHKERATRLLHRNPQLSLNIPQHVKVSRK